jgi:hypothetical protein
MSDSDGSDSTIIRQAFEAAQTSPIGHMQYSRYMPPLLEAGYSEDEARKILLVPVTASVIRASSDIPDSLIVESIGNTDELAELDIGTKWFEGKAAQSIFGQRCIENIESKFKNLSKIGVTPEDIKKFWDLPYFEREDVYISTVVNAKVAFLDAERQLSETGQVNGISPQMLVESSMIFATPIDSKVLLGKRDNLPVEALSRANILVHAYIEQAEPSEFMETAMKLSMNGLARVLLSHKF